jgi:hypothetical protein
MILLMETIAIPQSTSPRRHVLVDANTRQRPKIVDLLNDWQYLERTAHRLTAAWGRHMAEWDGKSALHRHIWDHAESVRRLRERVREFPGGKPDAPVSRQLEEVANALLFAPSFDDALDGIYLLLLKPLVAAYVDHANHANPIHDAPTMAVLHEINQARSQQWLWFRDYRRRHRHTTDAAYRERVEAAISACGDFLRPEPADPKNPAKLCGVGSDFTLPKFSARTFSTRPKQDFVPFMRADFRHNLEARRLFWAYAYMLEKNLPDDQMAWIYYGHDMPWDWHHDVSRHLWDESRHGDSGYSRLQDFGISADEVGFPSYNNDEKSAAIQAAIEGGEKRLTKEFEDEITVGAAMVPMTPKDLYEAVFFIGMIAENGHFIVKNEAYKDFQQGQDFESAEMMLFDIIDETTHVQYAHRWLPQLAERAGLSNDGYRERAVKMRAECETRESDALKELELDRSPENPAYAFYQDLLARIRRSYPLANAENCPPRSAKPM